ncbi:type II toxin-antitoxin system VapC family toxin [Singulisphaera rosea]
MSDIQEFVLDGSVTMSWYFQDEANEYADAVRDSLLGPWRAVVPALWSLEVANTLLVGERRKRSTPAQAATWLSLLKAFPIVVDGETAAHALIETLASARARNLSASDAAYLELAMRQGLPLATLDDRLKAEATAVGVALYTP